MSFRRDPTQNIDTNNYIPRYDFSDVLSLVNDKPLQMTRLVDPVTGNPTTVSQKLRRIEFAGFIQDDWKFRRNLTINIGLRYENYPPATDGDGHLNGLVLARQVRRLFIQSAAPRHRHAGRALRQYIHL